MYTFALLNILNEIWAIRIDFCGLYAEKYYVRWLIK